MQNSIVGLQYCSEKNYEYLEDTADVTNSAEETIDGASVRFLLVVEEYLDVNHVDIQLISSIVFIAVNLTKINKLIILHICKIDEIDFLFDLVDF